MFLPHRSLGSVPSPFFLEPPMPRRIVPFVGLILAVCVFSCEFSRESNAADDRDQVLFNFADKGTVKDWIPVTLPDVGGDQPVPKVEIVPMPKAKDDARPAGQGLKITYDGGDWPTIGTTRIPVQGNWKQFQTLKADLTVDRPCVAHFRIYQGT